MQWVSVSSTFLLLMMMTLVEMTWCIHSPLRRWTRQAIHCQANDEACKMCSTSCSSVEESRLPECCEAYNACCDEYFLTCKKCSSVAAKDQYFPEYCCASFTECCHLITTFTNPVKPPEKVVSKPKTDPKIPTVAAPKPTTFPGFVSPAPQSPLTSQLPPSRVSPGQGSSRGEGGTSRNQSGTRSQQRTRPATHSPHSKISTGNRRHGRITARGRVIQ